MTDEAAARLLEVCVKIHAQAIRVVDSCLHGDSQAAEEFAYDLAEYDTYGLKAAIDAATTSAKETL